MLDEFLLKNLYISLNEKFPKNILFGEISGNQIRDISTEEYKSIIANYASGLISLGISKGDRVVLKLADGKNWHFLDYAIQLIGAVCVPLFLEMENSEFISILKELKPKAFIGEISDLTAIDTANIQNLQFLIGDEFRKSNALRHSFISLEDIYKRGQFSIKENDNLFLSRIDLVDENDIATIIYTSGTTGKPKGYIFTHSEIAHALYNIEKSFHWNITQQDSTLSILPMAHITGRINAYSPLLFGCKLIFPTNKSDIITNFKIVQPTFIFGVPKILKKIYSVARRLFLERHAILGRQIIDWAYASSFKFFQKIDNDLSPDTSEIFKRNFAFKIVFSSVKEIFGGKLKFVISGGSALPSFIFDILRFSNITPIEGYGLSECFGPCCINPFFKQVSKSAGIPIHGNLIKLAESQEIILKSPSLAKAYLTLDGPTTVPLDRNGWFHTGDIGKFSHEGHICILGRKENLIETHGRKLHPEQLEIIFEELRYIHYSTFLLIDGRLQLFIFPDWPKLQNDFKLSGSSSELLTNAPLLAKLTNQVKKGMAKIDINIGEVHINIVLQSPSPSNGILTPTLKVRRDRIQAVFGQNPEQFLSLALGDI